MKSFVLTIVKAYLRTRRFLDGRLDRLLIRGFGGIHPKNVFNYRYEFFLENASGKDVVIDVGCGTGLILSKISGSIKKGYGLDGDPKLPQYWKAFDHGINTEYKQIDFLTFDFNAFLNETGYNKCILSHVLEHIEDVPSFLKRIAAQNLLICVPSQENWRAQLLSHLGLPFITDPTHFREYTREMLKEELNKAGYKICSMGFNSEGEIICKAEKL